MKYLHSFVLAACAFAWLGCRGFASAGGLCGGACLAGTWLAAGLGLLMTRSAAGRCLHHRRLHQRRLHQHHCLAHDVSAIANPDLTLTQP